MIRSWEELDEATQKTIAIYQYRRCVGWWADRTLRKLAREGRPGSIADACRLELLRREALDT